MPGIVKKLVKCGNSQAAILDKAVLSMSGIKPNSWVEIKVDAAGVHIAPASPEDIREKDAEYMARVMSAVDETHEEFDDVMSKLAE